jgi:hypothetical protein
MAQQLGNVLRQVAAEEQDARLDAGSANRQRLVDAAGPQRLHAQPHEFARDRHGAMAIGIGLDGGDQPPSPGQPAHDGEVVRKRAEIELGPQRPERHVVRRHAISCRFLHP